MTIYYKILILCFSIVVSMLAHGPAYADCSDPAGTSGTMDYFTEDGAYKFCDGTDWHSMKGGAASGDDVASKDYVDAAVAAGGGAGSLTVWGTTSCPSGWSSAYTGQAATLGKVAGSSNPFPSGFSSIICISGGLSWSTFGGDFSAFWWNGNGGSSGIAEAQVSCAVCVK